MHSLLNIWKKKKEKKHNKFCTLKEKLNNLKKITYSMMRRVENITINALVAQLVRASDC